MVKLFHSRVIYRSQTFGMASPVIIVLCPRALLFCSEKALKSWWRPKQDSKCFCLIHQVNRKITANDLDNVECCLLLSWLLTSFTSSALQYQCGVSAAPKWSSVYPHPYNCIHFKRLSAEMPFPPLFCVSLSQNKTNFCAS